MRIALLAPLIAPIAQPFIGGAQAMLRDLAVGLAARGHQVTLYAADGSDPAALAGVRLITVGVDPATLRPARFAPASGNTTPLPGAPVKPTTPDTRDSGDAPVDPAAAAAADDLMDRAFAQAYAVIASHADEHDLLHAHAYDWPAFAYAARQPLPTLHTLHLPAGDPHILRELATLAPSIPTANDQIVATPENHPIATTPASLPSPEGRGAGGGGRVSLVTVSHACAATYAPHCRIDAIIYNGIDIERIPFGAQADAEGYLLYAGRITPEKGVEDALEIASRSGRPLLLAGGVYDQAYYDAQIAPRLAAMDGQAQYLGQVTRERLWELMAGAVAVLCPSHWAEPFGLVACEAQAAGAPVIAYARGGLVEVIADGVTGSLVAPGDLEAATHAVARAPTLDRAACRAHVATRFSLARMLTDYEDHYGRMLA